MGKKHKKHRAEWRSYEAGERGPPGEQYYVDKPLEKPLKLVLKVGGSEVTECSGSGPDSSSEHEQRERHRDKKKKKKKKSEREKERPAGGEERRRRKEERKRKREQGEPAVEEPSPPPACTSERPVPPALPDTTPIRHLLQYFLRQLQRKDPHGFFALPVTDAIAPGYFAIIKHPMDFSTMRDKVHLNDYKSVTEFKADFKLMCDNAMTYNRPETVYYKLAKRLLHTGFKMMSRPQGAAGALVGEEDTGAEEPAPEVPPMPLEPAKRSKRPREAPPPCTSEPEGSACSLTDSTPEEHVQALVEHAADEARDRIRRHRPGAKMGYLRRSGDGTLLYRVLNRANPHSEEEETRPVDLSSLSSTLLPAFTTLGFKDERRSRVTFLSSASTALSMHNNSIFSDLKPEEMELLYSSYGDDTGVHCALSLLEFVKDSGSYTKHLVDNMLDQITGGDHSKVIYQIKQRRNIPVKPLEEFKSFPLHIKEEHKLHFCPDSSYKHIVTGESIGDASNSVLNFMSMKSYSDVSLDMSLLNSYGKMKKELDQDDGHLNLDETTKLLQDLHEAQTDRVGSRPSSNMSSLSNTSERDPHNLASPPHVIVGEKQEIVHDPYEFILSPDPPNQ